MCKNEHAKLDITQMHQNLAGMVLTVLPSRASRFGNLATICGLKSWCIDSILNRQHSHWYCEMAQFSEAENWSSYQPKLTGFPLILSVFNRGSQMPNASISDHDDIELS